MKTFLYILNTWLLSIFIALFLVILWARCADDNSGSLLFDILADPEMMPVLFICFAAATPSFFISWVFLVFILKSSYLNYEKLFLWLLAAVVSIMFDIIIVLFILDGFTLGM